MDRMAANTNKQPDVLRELFEALGNDPFVIAECLARPIAAERLLARLDANEKIDAEPKQSWLAYAETKTPITTAEARRLTYKVPLVASRQLAARKTHGLQRVLPTDRLPELPIQQCGPAVK
jgi:hypothetical protein